MGRCSPHQERGPEQHHRGQTYRVPFQQTVSLDPSLVTSMECAQELLHGRARPLALQSSLLLQSPGKPATYNKGFAGLDW